MREQDNLQESQGQRVPLLRRRTDLQVVRTREPSAVCYVLKDPMSSEYFRLREEEYFVWELLDGRSTQAEIVRAFRRQYPVRPIRAADMEDLLYRFHWLGLVISDGNSQGPMLRERNRQRRRHAWLEAFTNILSWRFPGVDVDPWLERTYAAIAWLFHPTVVIGSLVAMLGAVVLVAVQWDSILQQWPAWHEFFQAGNVVTLLIVLSATKIAHEFGHAYACKHFGGECHEVGILLLIGTPALYCDTTDSWLLASRWQRAIVGLAGMYVELLIAAAATYVWWITQEGTVHFACLRVMAVCSVSTCLFNANPLLRYDGYFVLSDLLGIPNLAGRSRQVLRHAVSIVMGIAQPVAVDVPSQRWYIGLLGYALSAAIYRLVLIGGIVLVLHHLLRDNGFPEQARWVVALVLVSMLWPIARGLWVMQTTPGSWAGVFRRPWRWIIGGIACVGLACAMLYPFPRSIRATLVLRRANGMSVVAPVPGMVVRIMVQPGDLVDQGAILCELANPAMELELWQLQAKRDAQRRLVATLEQNRFVVANDTDRLPSARALLDDLQRQVDRQQERLQGLRLKAPQGGIVLSPDRLPDSPTSRALPRWRGLVFDAMNRECWLDAGDVLCEIGDPSAWTAELPLEQSQRSLVEAGQPVKVLLDALPHRRWNAEVADIAGEPYEQLPWQLAITTGGDTRVSASEEGPFHPWQPTYAARIHLLESDRSWRPGQRGVARIAIGHYTWWEYARREWAQLVRFN